MIDQIAIEGAPFSIPLVQKKIHQASAVHTSSKNRRFAYSNSMIETDDVIWRMRIQENGYYAGGLAIGRLLSLAGYPAIRFCRSGPVTALFSLLYTFARKHFADIRIPERYLDELRGYADGTGIPYRTLFTVNFVFDVLKKYGAHCSSVVIAKSGSTLIGRNTDLLPWIGRLALKWFPSIVLDIATPEKLRYVNITPGLFLGAFNGFNERGVAVLSHQIGATKEEPVAGNLATTLLQRMLLEEATDIACAESITRANPIQRCISNMIVSSDEGASCVFEISPTLVKTSHKSGPYQCCVTHFQDEELSKLHRKTPEASQSRLRFMNFLAERKEATPKDLIAFLTNYDNGIGHKDSGRSPTNEGTYQSLVFDIMRHRIFIADGRTLPVSLWGVYREISVDI